MGRPVNKRKFGNNASNNIKVRAKIGTNAEGDGFIVSQRGTRKFKVTVGANTGVCTLVNKDTQALGNNEVIINVKNDAGEWKQVTKLFNRVAIIEGTTKVKWNFSTSTTDGAVEVDDVSENQYTKTITIGTQPTDTTVSLATATTATFTVAVSGITVADRRYQWQKQEAGAGAWADVAGATSASYTTGTLTVEADNTDKYRVVVSSASNAAASVTSAEVTLTVTA